MERQSRGSPRKVMDRRRRFGYDAPARLFPHIRSEAPKTQLYPWTHCMKLLSHVVWSEGMYLSPLHFQTQNRYVEDSLSFLTGSLWGQPWGLSYLELDSEAVRNGRAVLVRGAGIFPDGLMFDLPASDEPPPARDLSELFTPTDASLILYLAVPRRSQGGQLLDTNGDGRGLRYSVKERSVRDDTNGVDEREIAFGAKNLRVISEAEISPDVVTLPLTRVVRDGRGQLFYDPEFIPPCLQIGASEALMLLLKRLVESLQEKIAALAPATHRHGRFEAGTSALDVASYWFLHALSSAAPVLQHLHRIQRVSPETAFVELSRLAGSLCTFAADSDVTSLPAYHHADPGLCFRALDAHIRRHLEIVMPTNSVALEFTPTEPYIQEADVLDERCLRRARWIFGVRASLGEAELIRMVPRLIKVCSARFVPELVRRALPGMGMQHLPVPPSALRAEADKQYFSLDLAGPCWEHILQTRRVGVYVPGEVAGAEFDLNVIVETTT